MKRELETTNGTPGQIDIGEELTNGFAARYVRRKAKQLVGKAGLTVSDQEDIQQDLTVKILEAAPKFDPSVSHWNAFVATIVERYAANLLRDPRAQKRCPRRHCSLNTIVDYDETGLPITLGDTLVEHVHDQRHCTESIDDIEAFERLEDIATVLAQLPDDLRDICERLQHDSISQVARDLDIPRTTLWRRIQQIRQHFEDAGFEVFPEATG